MTKWLICGYFSENDWRKNYWRINLHSNTSSCCKIRGGRSNDLTGRCSTATCFKEGGLRAFLLQQLAAFHSKMNSLLKLLPSVNCAKLLKSSSLPVPSRRSLHLLQTSSTSFLNVARRPKIQLPSVSNNSYLYNLRRFSSSSHDNAPIEAELVSEESSYPAVEVNASNFEQYITKSKEVILLLCHIE